MLTGWTKSAVGVRCRLCQHSTPLWCTQPMEVHLSSVRAEWLDQVCCGNALQIVPGQYAFVVHTVHPSSVCCMAGPSVLLECAAGCASTVRLCGAHRQPHQQAEGGDLWGGCDGHGGGPGGQLPWQGPLLLSCPRPTGMLSCDICMICQTAWPTGMLSCDNCTICQTAPGQQVCCHVISARYVKLPLANRYAVM